MRERDIYPQDCPRTVRSRRNRFGNTELACSPKYHGAKTAYWAVGRQPGSYPETGFETISLQLNDHTDRGVGGRQYGASEDIETLEGKNNASTSRSRAVEECGSSIALCGELARIVR